MKCSGKIVFIFMMAIRMFVTAQQSVNIDSLKKELTQIHHDTTLIRIYFKLVENVYDPEIWPEYNRKAIALSTKLLHNNDSLIREVAIHGLADGLNNKGYYFNSVGRYDSAMYYYLRSTELMLKIKNKEGSAIVLMNIGLLLNNKGDYVGSIDYYYKSLRLFEELQDLIGISQLYNNLGSVYNYVGDKERAREYFYKSIEIKKKLDNPVLLSNGYNNLGSFYDKNKNYDSAYIYYNKALIIKRKYRDILGIMNVYNNIGTMYYALGKLDSAEIYLAKGLKLAESNKSSEGLAFGYNNLALVRVKQKKYSEAEHYVLKSMTVSSAYKLIKPVTSSYNILSAIYKSKKDFEKAIYYTERYHKFQDSLINNDKQRSIAVLQIKHDYEKEMFADSLKRKQAEIEKEMNHRTEIQKQKAFTYVGVFAAVFMFLLAALWFNRYRIKQRSNRLLEEKNMIISDQKEKVQQQKELIERKNTEVMDSINYAQRIQRALLSSDNVFSKKFKEFFVYFQPKDIVSGDFYWATELEDSVIVVTGDCTGHGVPGAFMSVLMVSKLSEVVKEKKITRPDLILNAVRKEVILALNPLGTNEITRDGMDAVVYKLNNKSKKLEFAAANNSFYIIKNNELIIAKPDKMPVGISDNDAVPFTHNEISLSEGDIIYTFTDGYADQFGGPTGKKYKYKKFLELLYSGKNNQLSQQKIKIESEFKSWKGHLEQIDDVCVIGIRV